MIDVGGAMGQQAIDIFMHREDWDKVHAEAEKQVRRLGWLGRLGAVGVDGTVELCELVQGALTGGEAVRWLGWLGCTQRRRKRCSGWLGGVVGMAGL